jgi:hypothetical protein
MAEEEKKLSKGLSLPVRIGDFVVWVNVGYFIWFKIFKEYESFVKIVCWK